MKFLTIIFMVLMIAGCIKEGIKDGGDAVQDGVGAVMDAGKKAPKAVGDASNKIEKDVKE